MPEPLHRSRQQQRWRDRRLHAADDHDNDDDNCATANDGTTDNGPANDGTTDNLVDHDPVGT